MVLRVSFTAFAAPPAVAVLLAFFPFSVPAFFIIRSDGDD
jgi:hypothetical protein